MMIDERHRVSGSDKCFVAGRDRTAGLQLLRDHGEGLLALGQVGNAAATCGLCEPRHDPRVEGPFPFYTSSHLCSLLHMGLEGPRHR